MGSDEGFRPGFTRDVDPVTEGLRRLDTVLLPDGPPAGTGRPATEGLPALLRVAPVARSLPSSLPRPAEVRLRLRSQPRF